MRRLLKLYQSYPPQIFTLLVKKIHFISEFEFSYVSKCIDFGMCSNPSNMGTLIDDSEDGKGNAWGAPGTE